MQYYLDSNYLILKNFSLDTPYYLSAICPLLSDPNPSVCQINETNSDHINVTKAGGRLWAVWDRSAKVTSATTSRRWRTEVAEKRRSEADCWGSRSGCSDSGIGSDTARR